MRSLFESVRAASVLIAVTALAACGGDDAGTEPDEPTPGFLTVALETPNGTEGAVLFRIIGPSIEEVTAYADGAIMESRTAGSTTTVALFGAFDSGPIARVAVPDTRASYTVQLQQVAASDNALRADLQSYALSIGE